ncbi:MAG TPA: YncE family protein [Thermoanaerobaculia bacterium]
MKSTLCLLIALLASPIQAGYHVVRHIAVGGEGGWDYLTVDDPLHRLFVSHSTEVDVINIASGKKVGVIDKLEGVHGIALAHDLGRGFITNGRSGMVTVFELSTLNRIADWKTTGDNPDAILYDRASGRLFTFNGRGQNATVFNAKSGEVVATIPLEGKPEFSVARGDGIVYVNIEDKSEIAEIDAKNAKVLRRWSLSPCESPSGLAFDIKSDRLFSVCENKLMAVSDAKAGKVLTTLPIGAGTDGAAFDSGRHVAFSSNGADGTITVVREVSPDKFEIVDTIQTARGARTIVLDERSHHLFVPTAKFGATPTPTPERPRPRPSVEPGTFEVLEVAP